MPKKITYLLGAGASANTIPVVADMYSRIKELSASLENSDINRTLTHIAGRKIESSRIEVRHKQKKVIAGILKDLRWLLDEAENFSSFDTLAKKYYLAGEMENYERLKKCLIFYFTVEQLIFFKSDLRKDYSFDKKKIDKRYGSFISAIATKANGELQLNNNINVLSWNYDLQFELNLQLFKRKRIDEIKKNHGIFPPLYYRENEIASLRKKDRFSLIKLNGNAVFATSEDESHAFTTVFDHFLTSQEQLLELLLAEWEKFDNYDNSACRFFNFAWEANNDFDGRKYEAHSALMKDAWAAVGETQILVVIGYSFPIFNREIDNRLFKSMTKLEKVYVQDREPEKIESTMRNAFEVLQKAKIVNQFGTETQPLPTIDQSQLRKVYKVEFQLEKNTNQFVIPFELNQ